MRVLSNRKLKFFQVSGGNGIFVKLEAWLSNEINEGKSGKFLVGDTFTAPDFHLYEMLDQFNQLAKETVDPTEVSLLARFPSLFFFYERFKMEPRNARYFASKLSCLPFNNKSASFGGTNKLSFEKWTVGMALEPCGAKY